MEFKDFKGSDDLESDEMQQAYKIYSELFSNFALSFDEVLEIVSDKDAINFLIEEFSEGEKNVIGFCSGVPLSKFDLIPEKLRGLVRFMMPKSFFVLAVWLVLN